MLNDTNKPLNLTAGKRGAKLDGKQLLLISNIYVRSFEVNYVSTCLRVVNALTCWLAYSGLDVL